MVASKHRIWLWSLPLAAISLGLISVAGVRGWRQPYDGLGWSSANSTITGIASQGPATTADIQVGDTVLAVNGIPVHEIASLYGGQAAGDHGLGRDAADVQAGAAQLVVFFNERGFQSVLTGADRGGVPGRPAADDGHVVDRLSHVRAPLFLRMSAANKGF